MNHAVYIGAGTDVFPLTHCHWIQSLVCIDSKPYSKYGVKQSGILCDGVDEFTRPGFEDALDRAYSEVGFLLTAKGNGNKRHYSCNGRRVEYHINTSIPDHHFTVKEVFQHMDTLIVSRHDPDCIFLKYTTKRLIFIGIEGTSFIPDETKHSNTVIQKLHHGAIQYFFKAYWFITKEGQIHEFSLWEDFVHFSSRLTRLDSLDLMLSARR